MKATNIIQQRELKPVWLKAKEIVKHYEKAANCITAIMGADYNSVEMSKHPKAVLFCTLCKRYNQNTSDLKPNEYPCSQMHREAVKKAGKNGGSHTYICPMGFFFWASPFFSGEQFAGAFISSGYLSIEKKHTVDKIYNLCKGKISRSQIFSYLEDIPEKTCGEISVLAAMMQLCAEQISHRESYLQNHNKNHIPEAPNQKEQERYLIASLRRGDSAEAKKIICKLFDSMCDNGMVNHEYIKFKAIELLAVLSRAEANSDNYKELFEINNHSINQIENSTDKNEITKILCLTVEKMAWKIFSFKGLRHSSALRKAERFIFENYSKKISLAEIAASSGLSAPYFSTIFKEEMGENMSNYLNRLRVEKASLLLKETNYPIFKISSECGFVDQSWFSKIFRSYTGISPRKYRENDGTNMPKMV